MSLFHSLEEHAEHILAALKAYATHTAQAFGAAHPDLLNIICVLEDHLQQASDTPVVAPIVAKVAPIAVEITEEVTKA